jgi:hypothetical protein
MEAERDVSAEVDPDESPFARPPGGGATIPFAKDSEEARAIDAVIKQADRERAAAEAQRTEPARAERAWRRAWRRGSGVRARLTRRT